jgi:tetratricopeptide (TPR) repeat protein
LAKRKITKKDLKQPDEFITLSTKIVGWCRDNSRIALGAAVGIAIVLLVVGGFFTIRVNREAKARALYEEALVLYPGGGVSTAATTEYAPVAAKLEEVQERYGSTAVGISALMDLGNVSFQSGDYDKAISCYQDFLQRIEPQNSFRDQVLESLGITHEAKGSSDAALEVYGRLLEEGSRAYQSQAQFHLGRVYETIGDKQAAMQHYSNYLKQNPAGLDSKWIEAKIMRWRLGEPSREEGASESGKN